MRRQIDILELRIEAEIKGHDKALRVEYSRLVADVLRLDAETYYTVASDLLGVIGQLLTSELRDSLRREAAYKLIRRTRNQLVRHSSDKPDGDPYPGFGVGGSTGVQLRTWSQSPPNGFRDPGFYENRRALQHLLRKYAPKPEALTEELKAWLARQCESEC